MDKIRLGFINFLAAVVLFLCCSSSAQGQADRVFISGVGDDTSACSSLSFFLKPWLSLQVWILASNIPIKSPYFVHVFLNIPARYHKHTQAT